MMNNSAPLLGVNPLLEDADLPDFARILPEHVVPATVRLIADHRAAIEAITTGAACDFASVVLASERADFALSRGWSPVSHLTGVADDDRLCARRTCVEAEALLTAYLMEAGQNRALHAALERVADAPGFPALALPQRRAVDLALRGFRLSGVALEGDARARFLAIGIELGRLGTQFGNAVLDATEAWSEHIINPAALDGIPETDRTILAAYAREKGLDGWLVTLRQPSVTAVLSHASDRDLRYRVYRANSTRASDQAENPDFDNAARIEAIMALRHESARLLGFEDSVALSLETKMAANAEEALGLLLDLSHRARPFAEGELAEARTFARARFGIEELEPRDPRLCGRGDAAHAARRVAGGDQGISAGSARTGGHLRVD